MNSLIKKGVVISVILLFFSMSVIPSSGTIIEQSSRTLLHNGNILYVGGNGTGNYTKIQDAINDSSDGDTVYVYNGTYTENVIVNKSINLIGGNKHNTIIDGNFKDNVTKLISDGIEINGFTIKNSISGEFLSYGIGIYSSNNKITNNIILDNNFGIYIDDFSSNNNILDNIISSNFYYGIMLTSNYSLVNNSISYNKIFSNLLGIMCYRSYGNTFYHNEIKKNTESGIELLQAEKNTIIYNKISNNTYLGIYLVNSNDNNITLNNISNNGGRGIYLLYSYYNSIIKNNITNNELSGIFLNEDSKFNTITTNNISSNSHHGIRFIESNKNTITLNNLISNK